MRARFDRRPALAAAVLAALVAGGCASGGSSDSMLREGWQYRWGDSPRGEDGRLLWLDPSYEPEAWKPTTPPVRPDEPRPGDVLWTRVRLPAQLPPLSTAAFVFIDQAFEAYLDGELIHSYGHIGGSTHELGRPAQLFSLGAEPAGKLLTLRMYSTSKSIGIAGYPRFGPANSVAGAHLRAHPGLSISTFLTLGMALIVLLFFAFMPTDRELPLLAAIAFLSGLYTIVSAFSPIKPLLGIEPSPQLSLGSLFIIPAVYCSLTGMLLKRRLFKWVARVMLTFVVVSFAGSLLGLFTMYQALAIYRVMAPLSMVLGLVTAIVDTVGRKEHAPNFILGYAAILLTSVRDALLDGRIIDGDTMWLSWGLGIAFVGHGLKAMRRYASGLVRSKQLADELGEKSVQLQKSRDLVVAAAAGMRDEAGNIATTVASQLDDARRQADTLARSRSDAMKVAEATRIAAEEAHTVAVAVQRSEQLSSEGQQSIERTTQAMLQLAGQVDQIARIIDRLSADAARITEVMNASQEVADQSKMLAINAALEAARAGESGQGFAVVAREMHALADRSGAATRQVKKLLTDVGGRTEVAGTAAATGLKLAAEVSALAAQAGASISGLDSVVREAAGVARGIEDQAREQSAGVEEVVAALDAAHDSVDSLLRSAGEVREAATSVRKLTEELAHTVQAS